MNKKLLDSLQKQAFNRWGTTSIDVEKLVELTLIEVIDVINQSKINSKFLIVQNIRKHFELEN